MVMKSKQLLLVAVLLGALLLAWVMAIGAAGNKEQLAAQAALVDSADMYAEKDLYIRAIPDYKEALTYQTEHNTAIEEKLLAVYLEYGDIDSYIDLACARIDAGTAPETEYVTLSEQYLAIADPTSAMETAKKGMARYESEACRAIYEGNRYACTIRFTPYDEILATRTGDLMPARDANGMTVVDEKAKSEFDDIRYTYLSRYNPTGYAVAKTADGGYAVITQTGDRYSIDENGLSSVVGITASRIIAEKDGVFGIYSPDFILTSDSFEDVTLATDGYLFAKSGGKWGILNEKNAKTDPSKPDEPITAYLFDDVARNALDEAFAGGLAAVQHKGEWYYVTTGAKKAFDIPFAGAKAPEDASGYLAVADANGKWGFIDRTTGETVIEHQYEDAHSFSQNVAAVKQNGEWFYISADNVPVIESVFYDAGAFHGGVAVADTPNGTALITLTYPDA